MLRHFRTRASESEPLYMRVDLSRVADTRSNVVMLNVCGGGRMNKECRAKWSVVSCA